MAETLPAPGLQRGHPLHPVAGAWWPGPLGQVSLVLPALVGERALVAGDCPTSPPPGARVAASQLWVWVLRREREVEGKLAGRLAGMVACPQGEEKEEEGMSA